MLEKDIEKLVCEYAKSKGMLAYKFSSPNHVGVPDRLFLMPLGKFWFCEFKKKGGRLTPMQEREHVRLREAGATVYVVDNIEDGRKMIDDQSK